MKNAVFILSALVLILTADCAPSRHIADLPKRALNIGAETSAPKSYPAKATRIAHEEVVLEIPAGALNAPVDVKIEELVKVESLNQGMKNITEGALGYRFLPDGLTFEKKVRLTVPYDRSKISSEAELAYLNTYFYNTKRRYWERLERITIDPEKGLISSYTTHFTDIINSTLTLPESPTPLYFNPTSIKDIKAADPGTGINLLEAPQANNQGSASLQYPIEAPPGRNGLQAQINLQYNSEGGNGFLGLGWDVSVSSISIDTRWGVPRYDDDLETETYLLDGSQLTPLAHRTEPVARTAEKEFHTRIEGAFRKIVRHGTSPRNYWWEVVDKNGLRFFYGGLPEERRMGQAVLAAGEEGPIFRRALVQMRDTHLNTVDYQYEKLWDSGVGDGSGEVKGVQLYLSSIRYTGTVGEPGPYSVRFIKDIDLKEQRRPDVSIDGRAGFKVVTASLLRRIEVKFEDRLIRAYELLYAQGAFQKTLLSCIVQYGSDGTEFCRHGFSYYDEVSVQEGYNGFAAPVEWNAGSDNISAGLWGFGRATAIGSATGDSLGGHLYAGVNPAGATKGGSAGFKVGYTRTNNNTVVALVDLNGDALADKVFKSGNRVYYRPQMKAAGGGALFGEPVALDTISDIGRDSSDTVSAGVESYIAVNVMANYSYTSTKSSVYFTDANGDGLVDLVADGIVYFNRLMNGVPTFSPDSNGTPAPVGTGSVDATEIVEDFSELYEKKIDLSPLMDAVRVWIAPYSGEIMISAPVSLIEPTPEELGGYRTADGVRVALQRNGHELWYTVIPFTDHGSHEPGIANPLHVEKGDRLYFRVQSVFDGAFDKVGRANLFPVPYRGWAAFAYNGNRERADNPIRENELVIDGNYDSENPKAFVLVPDAEAGIWKSEDDRCWVGETLVSSSRRGIDYISVPGAGEFAGQSAVERWGNADQFAFSVGFSFLSASYSQGSSYGQIDFTDMNGDRFPDVVSKERIQYTAVDGSLEPGNRSVAGWGADYRTNSNQAGSLGAGGNLGVMIPNARGETQGSMIGTVKSLLEPFGLSLEILGDGSSDSKSDLMDVNGDGLPDRVKAVDGRLFVSLSLGYSFAPFEDWGSGALSFGKNQNFPLALNIGFNTGDYGFGGGISLSGSSSRVEKSLIDLNGDGLVDQVEKSGELLSVRFNTGSGFAPPVVFQGALPEKHVSDTGNVCLGEGVYFTIPIWIPPTTISIIINPGFQASQSLGKHESGLQDVDGDGLPDHIASAEDSRLLVAVNRTGITNKTEIHKPAFGSED